MSMRPESPFQAGFGAVLPASSVEEHAANSVGWSLEFDQLGRGRFAGAIAMALGAQAQFATNGFQPGLMVRGSAPPGTVVLGVMLAGAAVARFRAAPLRDADLMAVRPGEEIDLRVSGPGRIFTATLQPERVQEFFEAVLGFSLDEASAGGGLTSSVSPDARQQEFERIGVDHVLGSPGHLADPVVACQFEEKVIHALCCGLRPARRTARQAGSLALACRAEAFLRANLDGQVTIRDLCAATGASERTLHESFRRHLGTTPKAHLKLLRLHAVRRALLRAEPGMSVRAVAMRWGFFHPGWFSHDYRAQFGCLPTETMRAGRSPRAVAR